jgi:hypothetical protein
MDTHLLADIVLARQSLVLFLQVGDVSLLLVPRIDLAPRRFRQIILTDTIQYMWRALRKGCDIHKEEGSGKRRRKATRSIFRRASPSSLSFRSRCASASAAVWSSPPRRLLRPPALTANNIYAIHIQAQRRAVCSTHRCCSARCSCLRSHANLSCSSL